MRAIQNLKYNQLYELGFRGSLDDMLSSFYKEEGVLSEQEWLSNLLGNTSSLNDLKYEYLRSKSLEGSINDMLRDSLLAGTYFTTAFSPASLFAAGEQGVWYDPSDMSTLFQDAAGTTPVTEVEQPVGLMLDKSRSLGPNLAPSTGSLSGWTLIQTGGSVTVVDGGLFLNTTGTGTVAASFGGLTSSARYLFEFEVVSVSGLMYLEYGAGGVARLLVPGKHRWCITGRTAFYLRNAGAASTSGSLLIKNVVVRVAPGNHASQPTTTARPLLSARYNILTDTSFTSTDEWGMGRWIFSGGEEDPFGGAAAAKVQMGEGSAQAPARVIGSVAGDVVFRIWWKAGNQTPVWLSARDDTSATILGSVRCDTEAVTGSNVTGRIIRQQNGFNLVELRTVGFPPGNVLRIYVGGTGGVPEGTHSFWYGPDLRLVCDADEGPTYQYVAPAAASYEMAGFSPYLLFDGVDDHLNLGVLNMSAASSAGYFSAITKLSDASGARWYSHGLGTSAGSVRLLAPANPGQASVRVGFYSSSGLREVGGASHAAPIKLTLKSEIEPGGAGLWVTHNNSTKSITSVNPTVFSVDEEACIGAQVFSSSRGNFFNGRIYALLVAGRKSSSGEQGAIESFLRNKSKAY